MLENCGSRSLPIYGSNLAEDEMTCTLNISKSDMICIYMSVNSSVTLCPFIYDSTHTVILWSAYTQRVQLVTQIPPVIEVLFAVHRLVARHVQSFSSVPPMYTHVGITAVTYRQSLHVSCD